MPLKPRIKSWLFALIGKDPEAVVVSFCSGDEALSRAMCEEIRRLEPSRRHFEAHANESWRDLRRRLRGYRIGLAPVLFTGDASFRGLRRAALLLAPTKILAYNTRLERHHLMPTLASWLFLRGVPLDRIFLRPRWLFPWKRDKTIRPDSHRLVQGRPRDPKRRSIAILTPYFPFPLSHGGAVRMFHLLREIAREFDIVLYAFSEGSETGLAPVLELVTEVYLVPKSRYREPRWSTFVPPEAGEYRSPAMQRLIDARETDLLQVEYTYLARYGGDILVEHNVTFDLYAQVHSRRGAISSWWDWWRWQRFERRFTRKFHRVVVTLEKDRSLLGIETARVIENGVDLARFQPDPERPGRRVLFIGSFRHFPNIEGFRFLVDQILPRTQAVELTVVAGPDPWLHWTHHTGTLRPNFENIRILEFVADVRPLYADTNLVVVPTLESAGTNVKVLEALAMERAVVSTTSGCAGLGLKHGVDIWIADTQADFASGINHLLEDDALRSTIAHAARAHAQKHFDWRAIGRRQRQLLRELLDDSITLRPGRPDDLAAIAVIQGASSWEPADYLKYECTVAMVDNQVAGFLACRQTAPGEREVLNIAVHPDLRRRGIARRLLEAELASARAARFLEVRESNKAAIKLYESLGFRPTGRRHEYYHDPPEAAIVMRFFS